MFEVEQQKQIVQTLKPKIDNMYSTMGIESAENELSRLEEISSDPNFWSDMERSSETLQKIKRLKDKLDQYQKLVSNYDDITTLIEIALEEDDGSLLDEIIGGIKLIEHLLEEYKLATLLSNEYDGKNALISFHAGAGGTESQDWVQMLIRMYSMFCDKKKFKFTIVDILDGEEAGIKSATVSIEGENAYGYLKSETGVHRLVRISPFDSSGRRHTSFASIEVIPQIDDDIKIEIRDEDLRVDTYRSSGAGGQHVNKTESAIRITHIPTGIVVSSQQERSQFQNREFCMKMLKSKLIEIKEREKLDKIEDIKGDQKDIAFGAQIRSYVFMPYTLVKDHRTGFECGNVEAVMNGDLDGFINAYLISKNEDNKQLD